MLPALWVAKTGLSAQDMNLTTISNNLANVSTTGFKRDRAEFEDLLYQTLRQPLARARYLLSLSGVDTAEDSNTAMPAEFLMLQMEWREAIMDARAAQDAGALETLAAEVRSDAQTLEAELAQALDQAADFDSAAGLVRKLRFLDKLEADIGDALEALLF